MPVFWLGEMANLITQDRYHDTFLFSWVPPLGYTPVHGGPGHVVQAPGDPVAGAVGALHRPLRAGAAGRPDRDRERGLRSHRPRQGSEREAGAAAPHAAHLDDQLRQPVRPRLRRAGGRRCPAGRGRVRPARRGPAHLPVADQPRPAGDHGHRHLRRHLHRDRERPCRRRPTPGSIRGCGRHERAAAARGARPERLVPHPGRHRARRGRRLVHRQPRRGAGHRGRVRLRQERDRDDADAADPRPERRVLGRGAVRRARPDAALTARHAAGARHAGSR